MNCAQLKTKIQHGTYMFRYKVCHKLLNISETGSTQNPKHTPKIIYTNLYTLYIE